MSGYGGLTWLVGDVVAACQILGMAVVMAGASYVVADQAIRGNASWQATITFLTLFFFFPALYFWEWVTWSPQ